MQHPMQAGAQPAPAPAPAATPAPSPGGSPEEQFLAQNVDPNNKLQGLLLKRIDGLTPQDGAALAGIGAQAGEALKKILPEVGFLIDAIIMGQGPGQSPTQPMPQPGMGGTPPAPAAAGPAPAPTSPAPRPEDPRRGRLASL